MILPFPATRAADEFDRIVDGIEDGANTRFAPLMRAVTALRESPRPVARPEFVSDLRAQLMAAADTELVPGAPTGDVRPTPIRPRTHRERKFAVAAATVVLVGGSAGLAAAAQSSLPGDPLYPVKRGLENVQVNVRPSEASRGALLLDQASTRLDELSSLVTDSSTNDPVAAISASLETFRAQAETGATFLFTEYDRDGDIAAVEQITTFVGEQMKVLTKLSRLAPPTMASDFAEAGQLLLDLQQRALDLCGTCDNTTAAAASNLPDAFALQSAQDSWSQLLAAPVVAVVNTQQQLLIDQAKAAQAAVGDGVPSISGSGTGSGTGSTDTTSPSVPSTSNPEAPSTDVSTSLGDVLPGLTDTVTGTIGGVTKPLSDATTLDEKVKDLTDPLLGGTPTTP